MHANVHWRVRGGQQRPRGGDGGGGAPQQGHDPVVIEGLESHELALADKGSLSSACGGKEGGRSGRRCASMQKGWASEVGGACSGGLLRVRTRAADLFPSPAVSSATGTRRNRAGVHGKDASGMGSGLAFLVVVDLRCDHIVVAFSTKRRFVLKRLLLFISGVIMLLLVGDVVVAPNFCRVYR